ncbi:NAD-dependent epimerase/dehydratase family protein [Streptomyces sp. NPDC055036]
MASGEYATDPCSSTDKKVPRTAVLGATGSLGAHITEVLSRAGHDVLGIARTPPSGAPAAHPYAAHPSPVTFVPLDVGAAGPAELAELLHDARVTAVVNATGGWGTTEAEMKYSHVRLVECVVEATARMPVRPRLVQLGSIHEYGPVPEGALIDERTEPRPSTAYARSKLAGSRAVLRATRAGRADGVVLRVVNVCGPRTSRASFLGAIAARLREETPMARVTLRVADARRDYIDVRDVARAVVLAMGAPVAGRVINIGRGEAVAMADLVAGLLTAAGLPPGEARVSGGPVESKGGGWTRADIRLAGELLGWAPRIALSASLRDMWEAAAGSPAP